MPFPVTRWTSSGRSLRGLSVSKKRRPATSSEPAVSLVVPTLNEAANVGWLLERVPPVVDEVILVDGLSDDGTIEAARAACPDVTVVNEHEPGKGAALRAGFARARGDVVVMIDADGSMDPGEIPQMVEAVQDGSDFVKGSRYLRGGGSVDISPTRNLGNRVLLALVNRLYGSNFTDLCYGFCAFRRSALQRLHLKAVGFEIETELIVQALRAKLTMREIPSFEAERRHGESNLNATRDGTRVLLTLLRRRWTSAPAARPVADRRSHDRRAADRRRESCLPAMERRSDSRRRGDRRVATPALAAA